MVKFFVIIGIEERTCLIEQGTSLQSQDSKFAYASRLVSSSIITQLRVIHRQLVCNRITFLYNEVQYLFGRSTRKRISLVLCQHLCSERYIAELLHSCEIEVSTKETSLILVAIEAQHLGIIVLVELIIREITLIHVSQEIISLTDSKVIGAPGIHGVQCTPRAIGKVLYATVLPRVFCLITSGCKHSPAIWRKAIL